MTDPTDIPTPFSVRLTREERARLDYEADGRSWAAYIKWKVFAEDAPPPPRRRGRVPVKDHTAISTVITLLGQSQIGNNLNQIAKAAHIGALPVTPELEAELRDSMRHVAEIRRLLIDALGLADSPS